MGITYLGGGKNGVKNGETESEMLKFYFSSINILWFIIFLYICNEKKMLQH